MHVQVVSEICMVKGRIYCGTRKFDTIYGIIKFEWYADSYKYTCIAS